MAKTNAMRLLESRGIPYTPVTYSPGIHSGHDVARVIGQPAAQVFKTLVAVADAHDWILVMTPSDRELDLRKVASEIGAKRVRMAARREAEAKTGLLAGGISPLALMHKAFAVYLDCRALRFDAIWLSAGQRGHNLRIAVTDLIAVTEASVIDAAGDPT